MSLAKALGYDWRLPFYLAALLGAIVVVEGNDAVQIVTIFFIVPVLLFAFLLLLLCAVLGKIRRQCLWLAGAIALFFLTSVALIAYQRDDPQCIRSTVRWLLHSHDYKAEVLAQPQPPGELKHVIWDAWGFVPAGSTIMYLVYDPSDALWNVAKQGKEGVVPGVPCPVARVHQLETHWYTVLYPTDFGWADCRSVGSTHQ